MVAVPLAIAVIFPSLTEATRIFEVDQDTFLFDASVGATVETKV